MKAMLILAILLAFEPGPEMRKYEGVWKTPGNAHPYQGDAALALTRRTLEMRIKSDSFFIKERFQTDYHTEDSCTHWPQDFYFKGAIHIKGHVIDMHGVATDSAFRTTRNKCMGDSTLTVHSTLAQSGDTLFFHFPQFDLGWKPSPIHLKRAAGRRGKGPVRK